MISSTLGLVLFADHAATLPTTPELCAFMVISLRRPATRLREDLGRMGRSL